jgi:hypothetical protein
MDADLLGTYTLADWRSHRRKATDRRACGEILGDPHRRTWEQHDESLEAFKMRLEKEAEVLHQTAR